MTTTGSSVLTDVSTLDIAVAMWRQFTQWFGGMGIIVLALAVLPRLRVGGRQLMESEAARARARGSDGLDPRHRPAALAALRRADGAPQCSSWPRSAGRESTSAWSSSTPSPMPSRPCRPAGSESIRARWRGTRRPPNGRSPLFMAIAGANFALLYRAFVRRKPVALARDEEFRLYLGLLLLASAVLTRDHLGRGHQLGRGGDPAGDLPDGLDHDDDRLRQHGLRAVGRRGARSPRCSSSRSCSPAARPGRRRARSRSSVTSS